MKNHAIAFSLMSACCTTQAVAQLSVVSFGLSGEYSVAAATGSESGVFCVTNQPDPYFVEIPEATLGNGSGTLSATFNGGIETELLNNGFRLAGTVFSEEPTIPFYTQSHDIASSVTFTLSVATPLRLAGFIRHANGLLPTGDVFLLNGSGVEFSGSAPEISFGAGPIGTGNDPRVFDVEAIFPAGSHTLLFDSFSRGIGEPGNALTSIDLSWDFSLTVVPSPAALALAPLGVLAIRRRR